MSGKKRPERREELYEAQERDARAELAALHHHGAFLGLTDMKALKVRREARMADHDPAKTPVYGTKWRNFAPLALFLFLWLLYFILSSLVGDVR